LGGLTVHQYQSTIERDQLGPHLRQLVRTGFLASCAITKARSGEGFVITFRPGSVFFTDYDRFYRRRQSAAVRFDFHDDRQGVAELLQRPNSPFHRKLRHEASFPKLHSGYRAPNVSR
jgi:hypothetical protein